MRQTSIETYNQIKESGLLTNLRFAVYECIFHNGPLTQAEASRLIGNNGENQGITPRFAELKKMGVIVEIGKRPCKITGRMVYEWETTNDFPKKLNPKMTTKDQISLLKATCEIAAREMRIHGFDQLAHEIEMNVQVVKQYNE